MYLSQLEELLCLISTIVVRFSEPRTVLKVSTTRSKPSQPETPPSLTRANSLIISKGRSEKKASCVSLELKVLVSSSGLTTFSPETTFAIKQEQPCF